MGREQVKGLLDLASEKVPCGVYAIQKGQDYFELKNMPLTKSKIKQFRAQCRKSGIKVYCNGI